ncbi:MAG: type II toxin-antitoxin system RelE/ParE family toxin [Smithellaceae bacterium]|nr:type II toxin-antitoxin system RelE/ParE family toxin [Smithellaceae bacterium]
MSYSIEFIPEAASDYKSLDGSVKKKVNKKLDELSQNPFLGDHLGNKFDIDLTGFYKLYVDHKRVRIVYHLLGDAVEVIEVWGIGKRDKEEIYRLIGHRLKKKG